VKPEISEVVERLRRSRSPYWLRVIDDAELERCAEDEPTPAPVVAPYEWLLKRVGDDGVRLTQAGYLPPALVTEAMAALGWQDDWIGKHNREDLTLPVLELRESAQRFGLLRKNRGRLLVTKVGRSLFEDPHLLWWHLAARLPDARSEPERQAGALYLLTAAAGRVPDGTLLAEGMSILGWVDRDTRGPLSPTAAFAAARDTWAAFDRLGLLPKRARWDEPEPPPLEAGIRLARAALVGRTDPSSKGSPRGPLRRTGEQAVQLTVTLRDIEPAIWRRLVVPESLTLRELHAVIQTAMGWQDYHLHLFEVDGVLYGDVEEMEGHPLGDEETFTVGQAAGTVSEFRYEYDFGDSWHHDIRIEQVMSSVGPGTPHLIGGARACPPEDCGGSWGYEHLLEVLADPSHSEHEAMLQWIGGEFDAEAFDLAETNANLELYDRHTRQRRTGRK
jgi:Plasmid pRiA4b ORF-3-like protein